MAYPVLAAKNTWWKPNVSTVTKSSITEIEIMDSYTPDSSVTVVDSWDASAAQDGSITCYVIGTKLIIAGNGSGKIEMNEDSSWCFGSKDKNRFGSIITLTGTTFFDTSNVTSMFGMFANCQALTTLDVSNWNVSNVTSMNGMFANCQALATLDVSNWNVSNVTDMNGMFTSCRTLTILDVSDWNVSNVTDMTGMFIVCQALTTLDVSNWDVSNVTNMNVLFAFCKALTTLNVSNWNTSNVTNMSGMFMLCEALTTLDVSNWDVSNVTDTNVMFRYCQALITLDVSDWNTSNITDMSEMFAYCKTLTILDVSDWNVSNVADMNSLFDGCQALTILDVSNWDVSNVTDMSFMFYECSSLSEIDVSNWDTSNVTTLDHFAAHAGLRRIGMEKWNTSSLTNANAAFHNCAEEELDLSGWDVSKVQFFSQMFENSPNLKRIKGLEKWNTSAGLDFSGMFERCYVLEELDLSSFDTSKAKNGVTNSGNNGTSATLNNMFLSCNNLRKITLGSNFAVNGDGTNTTAANKLILPTPSTDYITGADGNWYAFNGDSYAPNAIPDRTAQTYFASFPLCQDQDVIIKNGSLIDTAKAIREKNGATTQYTPSEFGAAIRAL